MASNATAVSSAIDPATMNSRRCHVIRGRQRQQHGVDLEYLGSYSGSSTRTIGSRSLAVCSSQQLSCPISKVSNFEDDFCRFTSHFLTFLHRFSATVFHMKVSPVMLNHLIPYLGLSVPPAPPSVALIKTCEAGLVLSVMPNFIEIVRTAAEICEFQYYASLA